MRLSARKARVVLDHIRGRSVPEARTDPRVHAAGCGGRNREGAALGRRERRVRRTRSTATSSSSWPPTPTRARRSSAGAPARGAGSTGSASARATSRSSSARARRQRAAQAPAREAGGRRRHPRPEAPAGRGEAEAQAPAKKKEASSLMGQKVHPGGLRVGVIHDWKSNWYTGKKEFADYILEDVRIREHIPGKLVACRAVRHPDPQGQAADHGRHLHGPPGHRDRQVGRRGRRAPQGAALDHRQVRPHQHQRDQAARARRAARRAVDRGAAAEPRLASGAR